MDDHVELRLTGRFALGGPGQAAVHDLARQTQLALAYLVLERGAPTRRDELADVLWGEALPRTWETAIRGVVSRARNALTAALGDDGQTPPTPLATVDGCYRVHLPGVRVDVEEAMTAAKDADRALGSGDTRQARADAERALTVTAQPFLPGLEGGWVEEWQRRLDDLHRRALELAARAALAGGEASAAVEYASRLIEVDPVHEPAYQIVIEAQLRSGNQVEARRTFERLTAVLDEELGLEPAPATAALLDSEVPAARPPAAAAPLPFPEPSADFVGRARELGLLDGCAQPVGFPRRVALIGGEPGIGKSRLAAEFARRRHRAGDRVLHGRSAEEPLLPYQPVVEALNRVLEATDDIDLQRLVDESGADLTRVIPGLADRLGVEPSQGDERLNRYLSYQAVSRALRILAAHQPTVLVLDDLHWADEGTCALLRVVISASIPDVIVVATYRDTGTEPDAPWDALHDELDRSDALDLHIDGLDEDELGLLLEAWAGHRGLPSLTADLREATGGNPFLVQELLRDLVESGDVGIDTGLASLPDLHRREIPRRASEVVLRRVRSLGPDAPDVLATAAVIGDVFDYVLLEAVSPGVDTLDAVSRARKARLLTEDPDAPGRLRFAHSLVRQTVLSELSTPERAERHRRIGEAIEALWPEDPRSSRALAYHFGQALLVGDDSTKAVEYAMRAGDAARHALAYEDAAGFYSAALHALDRGRAADTTRRADLLLHVGLSQQGSGDLAEAQRSSKAAFEEARRVAATETLARAALLFSEAGLGELRAQKDFTACEMLEAAANALDTSGPSALRARVLAHLSFEMPIDRDLQPRREQLSVEALAQARLTDDPGTLCDALLMRRQVMLSWPRTDERTRLAEEALAAARAWGNPEAESFALADLASDRAQAGAFGDAERLVDEYDALRDRLGHNFARWAPMLWRGARAVQEARLDEADGMLEGLMAARPESWGTFVVRRAVGQLLALRRAQGRLEEVAPFASITRTERPAPSWVAVAALVAWETGDEATARSELIRMFESPPEQWSRTEAFQTAMCCCGELVWQLREPVIAEHVARALRPFADDWVVSDTLAAVLFGRAARYLGLAVATSGHLDEGEQILRGSLADHRRVGATLWALYNQLDLAEVLVEQGGSKAVAEARGLAETVAAEAERLGARGLLPRAAALQR